MKKGESYGSNLLTASSDNINDIYDCINLAETAVWTGINKQNSDSWSFISGQSYDDTKISWYYNDEATYNFEGNCAYMTVDGNIRNSDYSCDDVFPFCCDEVYNDDEYPSTTSSSSSSVPDTNNIDEDCPRIRKEWNTASDEERQLFIDGLLELHSLGRLQIFTRQHANIVSEAQAHGTSAFLPWHRAFLFELEEQIRNLGNEYKCFALLYWNWARDVEDYGYNYHSYSIMNSGLGSTGDLNDNYCVIDGAFNKDNYTPFYCRSDWYSNDNKCCLRRKTSPNGFSSRILGVSQMLDLIYSDDFYGTDNDNDNIDNINGIRDNIEGGPHGTCHCILGSCESASQYNNYKNMRGHLGTNYSPDDPFFYLLHGFVDYVYALWQDYNDYEKVNKYDIGEDIYYGDIDGKSLIDDRLSFDVLIDHEWSKTVIDSITIRDVHSIIEMGYQYDAGSFIIDSYIYESCTIDSDWFVGNIPKCDENGTTTTTTTDAPYQEYSQQNYYDTNDSYVNYGYNDYNDNGDGSYNDNDDGSYNDNGFYNSQNNNDSDIGSYEMGQDEYGVDTSSTTRDSYSVGNDDSYGQDWGSSSTSTTSYYDSNSSTTSYRNFGDYGEDSSSYSSSSTTTTIDDYYYDSNTSMINDGYQRRLSASRRAKGRPVNNNNKAQSGETKNKNGGKSGDARFGDAIYEELKRQYGARYKTKSGRREMASTRAKMECEFLNSGATQCIRPKVFYDCSDMPRNGNLFSKFKDIDVTLDELINFVKDYPCMIQTRITFYGWAKEFGSLWRLCRGDYDTFCDNSFLRQKKNKQNSIAQIKGPNRNNNDGANNKPKGKGSGGKRGNDNKNNANANADTYDNYDDGDNKFNQLEVMVLNAVINGIIFSFVIVGFMLIYVCYQKLCGKQSGVYSAVNKYVNTLNDVEQN